jgi:hypothetical protein
MSPIAKRVPISQLVHVYIYITFVLQTISESAAYLLTIEIYRYLAIVKHKIGEVKAKSASSLKIVR